jgi:elongation factor Ts
MQITAAMVKELRDLTGAGMSACKNALVEANGDVARAGEILREKGLAAAAKKAGRVAAAGLVAAAIAPDRSAGAIVEVNSETDFVAKNEEFVSFVAGMAKHALHSNATTVEEMLKEPCGLDPSQTVGDLLSSKIAIIGENIGLRRFTKFTAAPGGAVVEYIHHGGPRGALVELNQSTPEAVEAGRNICMHIAMMAPAYLAQSDIPAEDVAAEEKDQQNIALKENETADKPKPANIIENMVKGRVAKHFKALCLLEQEYVKDGEHTVASYLKTVSPDLQVKRFVRFEKGEGVEKKEVDFAAEVAEAMKG